MSQRPDTQCLLRIVVPLCNNGGMGWQAVPGYEGIYSVSDHGEVRSEARIVARQRTRAYPAQILKQRISNGYPTVNLTDADGKRTTWRVHVLVLLGHVGPRPPGLEGLHDNDIKTDCRVENLYWGTRFQNKRDEVRNGKHANANKTCCPRCGGDYTLECNGRRRCRTCCNEYRRLA